MVVLWTIVTLAFVFAVISVFALALMRMFTGEATRRDGEAPAVDAGWRAFSS